MNLRLELTEAVSAAFAAAGYEPAYGGVTVSNRPDLCHYQCNGAMAAAKKAGKPPLTIAGEVAAQLAGDPRFASVEAVKPGFLNLTVSARTLAEKLGTMRADERLALPAEEPRCLVVDYGGPNLAKPMHVGHLRSAIIGETLCRLARFLGHRVIGDAHFGDWGLQMGLCLMALQEQMPDSVYFDAEYEGAYPETPPFCAADLIDLYPRASQRSKTDADFAARAGEATVELQAGRRGYRALWQHMRDLSMTDLTQSYDALGVRFDTWYGESDAEPYIPEVIALLRDKGLLTESEGAQVVMVEREGDKEPMPPLIMVKTNGGDMYGTTDVATIYQRVRDYQPDEILYVVDNRQALHFKQVFRCVELAGFAPGCQTEHISFGTMNGADGKPYKTREGGVMRLSDLIESVTANARAKLSASEVPMTADELDDIARKLGISALKIGDMVNHRVKDILFDMERFLASEGKTGPYLLYSCVRIRSVLDKARERGFAVGEPLLPPAGASETALALALLRMPDALSRAMAERLPNVLCECLFDIAQAFNRFYFETKILACEEAAQRGSWLSLLDLTGRALTLLLDLLGIETVEKM